MIIMPNIFKDMGADVRVRVRSSVVAVKVERTVVLVLVVVTANVQHNTTRVVVAAIVQSRNAWLLVWKSQCKKECGKGLQAPLFPHPSTPKRFAFKVIFGDGSRCPRSGSKQRCCR